ncbi:MAG: hypothetical protein COU25_03640 [Candidatus Levybacteria bacterium CG10_big_fil_rev_8_21_14_0_10_35_13]|nr:MAG: hypothetical protein COU25_03640 [Candidatus Levybacteria bacterium CG10_big_fil_rev_8_21_14_0_10_35_13]
MKQSNNKTISIIFFGTSDFVNPVLNKLKENFDVVKVINSPQQWNNKTIEQLSNLNPDLFVVVSYGQILPKKLLDIPKLAAINIHPSLLPKYRGSTPVQTAILNGDKTTGVTIIKLDEHMDHGPIIEQFEEPILPTDTFESLIQRLFEKSADALVHVIMHYNENKLKPQNHSKATFTKLLKRDDGYINLSLLEIGNWKLEIDRKIRAYYPWPGVWVKTIVSEKNEKIIKFLPNKKIQVEGKKEMSYKDFLNGYPDADSQLRLFLEKNV